METRITTLIENSQGEHLSLKTEHGISFLIEKNGHKMLFDTGQTGAFIENAQKLGLSLNDLEFVAVSHGHYDHSGGLRRLSEINQAFTLITGKDFFRKKYATDGISYEYLGNDFDETFLEYKGIRHRTIQKAIEEILPGIFVLTAFPRIHPDEVINPRFVVQTDNGFVPDDFSDEICVAVETKRGFAVLLGCSHPGMKNMLDAAASLLPVPLFAVMGGTHLVEASPECLAASVSYLQKYGFGAIGLSHCTGEIAVGQIARTAKGFFRNTTGHALII
jgi:7,8-dihydropterin-6-yl-methyl-4-(beta-D-ribofuranosyl)aminobenzene 5'-phosphate synthase